MSFQGYGPPTNYGTPQPMGMIQGPLPYGQPFQQPPLQYGQRLPVPLPFGQSPYGQQPPPQPMGTGMIIGIVIFFLALVGGIVVYMYRDTLFKPKIKEQGNKEDQVDEPVKEPVNVDKSCPTDPNALHKSCEKEMLRKTCKISNMDLLCAPGENLDVGCEGPNCWFYPSQVLIEFGGTKEPPISWNNTKQAPMAICAALVKNCQKLGGTEQDCVCKAQKCVNGGTWEGQDAMELYTRLVKEGMDSTLMSFQDAQDLIALGCPKT